MKKVVLGTLLIVALFSLSLPAIVSAIATGYGCTNYSAIVTPTIDGKWTASNEWTDAGVPTNPPTNFAWREKWTWPGDINQHILIEFFTDSTNNTEDYYQICYDRNADGGAAPQADDIKIEWKGHSSSGLKVYKGNGTGWTQFTGLPAGTVVGADTLTTSPLNSNQHWVFEITINKSNENFDISGSGYSPGIQVGVYDASNSGAGVQVWPLNSNNNPANWGLETGTTETIPESPSILAVIALSTIAIIGSVFLLRKRLSGSQRAVNTGLSKSF
ncbi:MAG: hypothetical protein NWE95_11480 [Candidatus Bathyarchaeota archaeon]|nr:hypothetical protein [Candidatus Bathyarchaeota archaeon]